MIASAIGKPATKAPTIVKVKAESRFTSVRALSIDIAASPTAEIKSRHRVEGGDGFRVIAPLPLGGQSKLTQTG
jgi:hypothetical protein